MNFEEFIEWAKNSIKEQTKFQTLGKRSQFDAQYDRLNSIKITNSSGNTLTINEERLKRIFERYVAEPTDMKHMASYYSDPKWPTTPSRIFAPYVPAILRDWVTKCR